MAEKAEDLKLPVAAVLRIIKDALPDGVHVTKEVRVAVARAASIFVLYTTSTANNYALKAKRKTIMGADILAAMNELEFEEFVEPLKAALKVFKAQSNSKKLVKKASENDDNEDNELENEEIEWPSEPESEDMNSDQMSPQEASNSKKSKVAVEVLDENMSDLESD